MTISSRRAFITANRTFLTIFTACGLAAIGSAVVLSGQRQAADPGVQAAAACINAYQAGVLWDRNQLPAELALPAVRRAAVDEALAVTINRKYQPVLDDIRALEAQILGVGPGGPIGYLYNDCGSQIPAGS